MTKTTGTYPTLSQIADEIAEQWLRIAPVDAVLGADRGLLVQAAQLAGHYKRFAELCSA